MKKNFIILCFLFVSLNSLGQGYNYQWLLGYWNFQDPKGRMLIDSTTTSFFTENRKMAFWGTEANISNATGGLLMSSNGVWIANAVGDTMMNGSGLSPSYLTTSWPLGLPLGYGNIFLTYPDDNSKFILFHESKWGQFAISPTGIYKSIIDITLDNGLGAVIEKNDTLLSDTLSWGIGACRHANGRDWWVVAIEDGNPAAYTFLITPNGIDTVFYQSLGFSSNTYGNVSQIIFSQDGKKMIYCTPTNQNSSGTVLSVDFDRCTGLFSNLNSIEVAQNSYLYGLAFSPSGKYIYTCSSTNIFQIDTGNLTVDTVATYDGFISPAGFSCCATTFWNMYLAANGKIYVTSGSGVQHIHEINYPDSLGIACDVQQHAINLGYAQLRAVPNHPNYYLGCDSTSGCTCLNNTGIDEIAHHDFKFSISPNPNDGNFKIMYLLPQNKNGRLEIFDVNGRQVYMMNLPQWSTMQEIVLPSGLPAGVYNCVITSGGGRVNKKIAVIKN